MTILLSAKEKRCLFLGMTGKNVAELGEPGVSPSASCSSPQKGPGLPRRTSDDICGHRDKLGTSPYPDNLCVARLVGKAEIEKYTRCKGSHEEGVGSTPIKIYLGRGSSS